MCFNHAYQAEAILQALAAMAVTDPQDPDWIPDTGASSHMTNNPGIFNIIRPYSGNDTVIIGDGKILHISHVGLASLTTSHGHLPLSNVLLVPKLTKTLLSCIFEITSDGFVIRTRTGRILATGTREGGVYALGSEKQEKGEHMLLEVKSKRSILQDRREQLKRFGIDPLDIPIAESFIF